jgi:flavin-dependent dehydrogenase
MVKYFDMNTSIAETSRINNIVILGGGTSGWTAALRLALKLNQSSEKICNITVIESPDLPTVGVGEATTPLMRTELQSMGFDEYEWMKACSATFKLGVRFEGWSGREGYDAFNTGFGPLASPLPGCVVSVPEYMLLQLQNEERTDFRQDYRIHDHLVRTGKSPKAINAKPYQANVNYAYHLDAFLHAEECKKAAKNNGVRHIPDTVTNVDLDDKGFITALETREHGKIKGDLFIDSSGFKGLLINETLKEPFNSYSKSLLCDSAVVIKVPRSEAQGHYNSFTNAKALKYGWVWEIPLIDHVSYGYVYSGKFISKEEAEEELMELLGERAGEQTCRHLKMRIGKNRNSWVKNCVAIGLADGFIEPLESTGLALMNLEIGCLLDCFPNKDFNPALQKAYNTKITRLYESVLNFIAVHYCVTNREDTPFWSANKYDLLIPDDLQDIIDGWNAGRISTSPSTVPPVEGFFQIFTYARCFFGVGYLPKQIPEILHHIDSKFHEKQMLKHFSLLKQQSESFISHREFLQKLHSEEGIVY